MRGRGRISVVRGVAAGTAALALLAVPQGALAKVSKKKIAVTTRSASTGLSAGTGTGAGASCPGKSHMTGGGFAVAPSFTPPATGLRSMTVTNQPADPKTWTATGSAFTSPAASGNFTTFVRCEGNLLGKIALIASSSATLPSAAGQDFVFNCPPGTHVISGGYAGDPPNNLAAPTGFRIVVLQSRRTGIGQWTISAYNRNGAPPSTITGYAVCERDEKKTAVSEVASAVAPLGNDARAVADASCTGKKHVVSGGFLVSPATFPGSVPVIGVDENQPVGKKGWHLGVFDWVGFAPPPGSSLQGWAYCKKDRKKKEFE